MGKQLEKEPEIIGAKQYNYHRANSIFSSGGGGGCGGCGQVIFDVKYNINLTVMRNQSNISVHIRTYISIELVI